MNALINALLDFFSNFFFFYINGTAILCQQENIFTLLLIHQFFFVPIIAIYQLLFHYKIHKPLGPLPRSLRVILEAYSAISTFFMLLFMLYLVLFDFPISQINFFYILFFDAHMFLLVFYASFINFSDDLHENYYVFDTHILMIGSSLSLVIIINLQIWLL